MSVPNSTMDFFFLGGGGREDLRDSPGELAGTFFLEEAEEEALFFGRAGGVLRTTEVLTGFFFNFFFLKCSLFIPARSKVFSTVAGSASFPVSPPPAGEFPSS